MRLPAFGRALLAERRAGRHPARVWVLCGDDWSRRPAVAPVLCVGADWRAGTVDWLPVAGVPVHVVDRGGPWLEPLAAEIAIQAAPVVVHWHADGDNRRAQQEDVSDLAWAARRAERGRFAWPDWWSDLQEADYRTRRAAYYSALADDVEAWAA